MLIVAENVVIMSIRIGTNVQPKERFAIYVVDLIILNKCVFLKAGQ